MTFERVMICFLTVVLGALLFIVQDRGDRPRITSGHLYVDTHQKYWAEVK